MGIEDERAAFALAQVWPQCLFGSAALALALAFGVAALARGALTVAAALLLVAVAVAELFHLTHGLEAVALALLLHTFLRIDIQH